MKDPGHIDVYVTPYYNAEGPSINVGPFSGGLATNSESAFVATISKMRQSWDTLTFAEMYAAAMQLYDRGFRNEATYWFYSAQYRARVFSAIIDRQKMGSLGDAAFELTHAAGAFHQLAGDYINSYAFGDVDYLAKVIERVQKEGARVPDFQKIYPEVTFRNREEWETQNKEVAEGLTKLLAMVKEQRDSIKKQRTERGLEAKFSKLTSKELPRESSKQEKGARP
jgi:hypothetical protein